MQKREFPKSGLAALGDLGFLGAARAGGPAVTKKVSDVRRDEEWDTVIVDSGIAATFVENEALDRGLKKVIMIEKMLVFGGNSESPIPNRNGANSKAQARMCGLLRRRGRKPVPTAQYQTCHDPKSFDQNYHLANGKATPHVSIRYAPETVDCALCHRERGFFVCGSDTRVRYNVSVLCDSTPGSLPSTASSRTRFATRRRVFQEAFNYVHHHRRR